MLADVQNIMAKMIRDKVFLNQVIDSEYAVLNDFPLSSEEISYLKDLDLNSISKLSFLVKEERIVRRDGEFGFFVREIKKYLDYDDYALRFTECYKTGSVNKIFDAKQYYHYFSDVLLRYNYPGYLFELLHFCYKNTCICWVNYNEPAVEYIENLSVNDKLVLSQHRDIIKVRASLKDYLNITFSEDEESAKILIVKHPSIPKTTSFTQLTKGDILSFLIENNNEATLLQLIEKFGISYIKDSIDDLNDKIERGFIKYIRD
ncbi:hypothetical protein [Photorhabdus antumapuensis]|uniref:hypothetical protein n=1 Tax=Photorhabdus antumapuensis TaxID=2862867 RepID=UPI001CED6CE9|nr:hypothetical protein [Photorhabdus antumapuensis]MCA6222472.1 hypothetical protein [Photorhabdus antumapuensis]